MTAYIGQHLKIKGFMRIMIVIFVLILLNATGCGAPLKNTDSQTSVSEQQPLTVIEATEETQIVLESYEDNSVATEVANKTVEDVTEPSKSADAVEEDEYISVGEKPNSLWLRILCSDD